MSEMVKCSHCGEDVHPKNLDRHIRRVHQPSLSKSGQGSEKKTTGKKHTSEEDLRPCPECGILVQSKNLKKHRKSAHGISGGRLKLLGRRGSRNKGVRKCAECGIQKPVTWRYSNTSKGIADICEICKPRVFDRSFGSRDALDFAVSGGGFETNRKKY